jgi:hypothetical protein
MEHSQSATTDSGIPLFASAMISAPVSSESRRAVVSSSTCVGWLRHPPFGTRMGITCIAADRAAAQRALHARAADWFDGRDPILRASHLDRAESPAAADAYHLAAEDRLRRYRPAEALPLVERGLALAAAADSRAALLLLKADALLDAGRRLPRGARRISPI